MLSANWQALHLDLNVLSFFLAIAWHWVVQKQLLEKRCELNCNVISKCKIKKYQSNKLFKMKNLFI